MGFCKIKREKEKTHSPRHGKERNLVWEGFPWKDAKGRGKKTQQSQVREKFQLMFMRIYEQLTSIQKRRQGLPWLEVKLRTESSTPDLGK